MKAKQYVYLVFLVIIAVTCVFVLFNYVTDKTGIFNGYDQLYRTRGNTFNQHFVKMRYLINNPEKYNGFCFGSSIVGYIDLDKINNGLRWYNMTYSSGLPEEWRDDIKLLLKRGVSMKSIILGVDAFDMTDSPMPHEKQFSRIPYRDNNVKAYFSILFRVPNFFSKKEIMSKDKYDTFFDAYNSGRTLNPAEDEWIEANDIQHLRDNKFNLVWVGADFFDNAHHLNNAVQALRDIKDLCQEHGIELIVVFNPMLYSTYYMYDAFYSSELDAFKRRIAEITPFYDFSGLNRITTDKYYYYESLHYRPIVGDMIIKRIFTPEYAQKDFGVYVTKNTIDEHIANLKRQMDEYDAY